MYVPQEKVIMHCNQFYCLEVPYYYSFVIYERTGWNLSYLPFCIYFKRVSKEPSGLKGTLALIYPIPPSLFSTSIPSIFYPHRL